MVVEALLYRELGTVAGPENAACIVEECMDQHSLIHATKKRREMSYLLNPLCASRYVYAHLEEERLTAAYNHRYLAAAVKIGRSGGEKIEKRRILAYQTAAETPAAVLHQTIQQCKSFFSSFQYPRPVVTHSLVNKPA